AAADRGVVVPCRVSVRCRQAGAGEPQKLPQVRAGRRDRVARGYRRQSDLVPGVRGAVRRGGARGRARTVAHGQSRDPAADDVLRDAPQPGARVLQPDPDPAARRQPCVLPPPAAGLGAEVPPVLPARHAPLFLILWLAPALLTPFLWPASALLQLGWSVVGRYALPGGL